MKERTHGHARNRPGFGIHPQLRPLPDARTARTGRRLQPWPIIGYFVSPDEYEEFRRFREARRSFATAELSEAKVEAIRSSRMNPRHAHLDRMLEPK